MNDYQPITMLDLLHVGLTHTFLMGQLHLPVQLKYNQFIAHFFRNHQIGNITDYSQHALNYRMNYLCFESLFHTHHLLKVFFLFLSSVFSLLLSVNSVFTRDIMHVDIACSLSLLVPLRRLLPSLLTRLILLVFFFHSTYQLTS